MLALEASWDMADDTLSHAELEAGSVHAFANHLDPKDQHLLDLPLVLLLRSPRQSELWVVDCAVHQHIHRINMHAQPVCPVLCSWHALS